MPAHSTSNQLSWKLAASRPISVTWCWTPMPPGTGTPYSADGATTGSAAAGAAVFAAACSVAAAAGAVVARLAEDIVTAAAARAIAHPIGFILTPKIGLPGSARRRGGALKSPAL
jgi:hypothetical protein